MSEKITYMTYNPHTGENIEHETKDAALDAFHEMLIETALKYWYGCPYTVVKTDEHGMRTMFTDHGEEIELPNNLTLETFIERLRRNRS